MEEEIVLSYLTNKEAEEIFEEQIALGHLFLRHDTRHNKLTFKKTNYFPILIKDEVE